MASRKFISKLLSDYDPDYLVDALANAEQDPDQIVTITAADLIGELLESPHLNATAKESLKPIWELYQEVWMLRDEFRDQADEAQQALIQNRFRARVSHKK